MAEKREDLPFQTVEGDGVTWVEIASCGTQDEAVLLKGFLDAEGIAAEIENVKFTMAPTDFGKMGDIRIYVASEDETKAMDLLKQRNKEYDRLTDDEATVVTDEGPAEIDENTRADNDEP
jgi:hypothetical protein